MTSINELTPLNSRASSTLSNYEIVHPRHGTVASSVFNLTASAVGAGVLVLPFSIQCSGLVLGLGMLTLLAVVAWESFHLLERSCRMAKIPLVSIEEVAEYYWGPGMRRVVQFSSMGLLFCALITFEFLSCDNILPVLQLHFAGNAFMDEYILNRYAILIISTLLIFPFCLSSELHTLRYSSAIVLMCIGYIFVLLVLRFGERVQDGSLPTIKLARLDETVLYVFSVHSLSYCAQFNVLPLFSELKNPTKERMNQVKTITVLACVTIFGLFGALGYVTFGHLTPADIFNAFDSSQPWVAAGRLALGVSLLLKCPLVMHPLRLSIQQLSIFDEENELAHSSPALDTLKSRSSLSHFFHHFHMNIITFCLLALSMGFTMMLPTIQLLYGISGSTVGGMVCFIIPSTIFLGTPAPWSEKIRALMVFLIGITSMAASLYVTFNPPDVLADALE